MPSATPVKRGPGRPPKQPGDPIRVSFNISLLEDDYRDFMRWKMALDQPMSRIGEMMVKEWLALNNEYVEQVESARRSNRFWRQQRDEAKTRKRNTLKMTEKLHDMDRKTQRYARGVH